MKSSKVLCAVIASSLLVLAASLVILADKYTVPIVMYHQVGKECQADGLNCVSEKVFEKQMQFLRKFNYNVISFHDLIESYRNNQPLPWKTVVITFDDGYEDNYTHAYPILKKYDIPATIFVVSGFTDKKGYLTWFQIAEMKKSRIDFGAHSHTHLHLPDLSSENARQEMEVSKKILEEKLQEDIKYMAYPFGGFNTQIKDIAKTLGYQAVCTTNRGTDRFNKDLFELKRVKLTNKDNRVDYIFWKLTGFYNLTRKLKSTGSPAYPHEN